MDELLEAFRQAVMDKDWDALRQIDDKLRIELSAQLELCDSEASKRSMASLLKRLQKVYALAERNARDNYQEIAAELGKLKQDQRAVKAYQQGSQFP